MKKNDLVKLGNFAVVWLEQNSSIQLKFTDSKEDPIELSESEAEHLAAVLLQFVKKLKVDE
jgi:hypothetical protein